MVPLVEVRFRLNGWPRPHGRGKRASNEMADLGQRSAVVGSDTVDNTLLIVRKRWESRSGESPSSAATLMLSGCAEILVVLPILVESMSIGEHLASIPVCGALHGSSQEMRYVAKWTLTCYAANPRSSPGPSGTTRRLIRCEAATSSLQIQATILMVAAKRGHSTSASLQCIQLDVTVRPGYGVRGMGPRPLPTRIG